MSPAIEPEAPIADSHERLHFVFAVSLGMLMLIRRTFVCVVQTIVLGRLDRWMGCDEMAGGSTAASPRNEMVSHAVLIGNPLLKRIRKNVCGYYTPIGL